MELRRCTHSDTCGDLPPLCRAHSATLMTQKIVIIGAPNTPYYSAHALWHPNSALIAPDVYDSGRFPGTAAHTTGLQ